MCEEGVVHRLSAGGGIGSSRCEESCAVTGPDRDRLVESGPTSHSVAESVENKGGVLREPIRAFAVGPTSTVLQCLWQVPVVERDVRLDVSIEQAVDDAIVVVTTGGGGGPPPPPRG